MGKGQMWLSLVKMIVAPILSTALAAKGMDPEKAAVITTVTVDGINEAEDLFTAGSDKKAHVLGLVKDAMTGAISATGTTKVSADEITALVGQGIDVGVKAVNEVHSATA